MKTRFESKSMSQQLCGRTDCNVTIIIIHIITRIHWFQLRQAWHPRGRMCRRELHTDRTHAEPGTERGELTFQIIPIILHRYQVQNLVQSGELTFQIIPSILHHCQVQNTFQTIIIILHRCQVHWHIQCRRGVLSRFHIGLPEPDGCNHPLPTWRWSWSTFWENQFSSSLILGSYFTDVIADTLLSKSVLHWSVLLQL